MTRKSRYPLLSLALLVLLVTFARRPIRAQEPFSFIIDEDVNPRRPTLEPLADGAERPLGAIQSTDGSHDDFLLDEVILYAPDQASLESFMATYEASLL